MRAVLIEPEPNSPTGAPTNCCAVRETRVTGDGEVELLGEIVVSPPWLVRIQLSPIRLFETGNVRRVLDVLTSKASAAAAASKG